MVASDQPQLRSREMKLHPRLQNLRRPMHHKIANIVGVRRTSFVACKTDCMLRRSTPTTITRKEAPSMSSKWTLTTNAWPRLSERSTAAKKTEIGTKEEVNPIWSINGSSAK
uniref:Uncharacterized protein n=1 Tax=Panagrellus redivivus TaxID=6233 RepID=A0A7E4UMS4_PANRE